MLHDWLGALYITAWSISSYTPILTNIKHRSAQGVSFDFAVLNSFGYLYMTLSMFTTWFCWVVDPEQPLENPQLSWFDLLYSLHGSLLNWVLLSQLICGERIWGFHDTKFRMKTVYYRVWVVSMLACLYCTLHFVIKTHFSGWDNSYTLRYCNQLFMLKVAMSFVKYIPQILYNAQRQSVKGFSTTGVCLDMTGGIASLLQFLLGISKQNDYHLDWHIIWLNIGKISLSLVTMGFCSVFLWQWSLYKAKDKKLPLNKL